MTSFTHENANVVIRPVQYRDLDAIERLVAEELGAEALNSLKDVDKQLQRIRQWYGPLKFLGWFPNPCQYDFCMYVAEQDNQVRGIIKISPFNRTRSTWRVEWVMVDRNAPVSGNGSAVEIGSQLLRHCFEAIWEARTWVLEVNIQNKAALALYRQNGFQPLAQLTYWAIAPELLQQLLEREADLPNLLPVSNADAQLLYQLDTVSMPPLLRQVFDRHIHDFKSSFLSTFVTSFKHLVNRTKSVCGYVFEPQRKAAIGYFHVQMSSNGSEAHIADLTVHPAYTWLYPELLSQMAKITQDLPSQSLQLASADYQPEREEYLEQLGATRIEHSLLMSRSVWHKLREAKQSTLEALQLSEVLQSLQPARKPVPSRITWHPPLPKKSQLSSQRTDLSPSSPSASLAEDNASSAEQQNTHNNGLSH